MSKKLKISFEDSGTQVDALYFRNDVLERVKGMAENDEVDDVIDYIRQHSHRGMAVACGMLVHSTSIKCFIEDGDEQLSVPILNIMSEEDESMSYEDWLLDNDFENSDMLLVADMTEAIHIEKEEDPRPDEHVMLEVIEYDYGQLTGFFEVEDNVTLKDLNWKDFVLQTLNLDRAGELGEITYGEGIIGTMDEDEVFKLSYKGKSIELNLAFQGGGGGPKLFVRDEDGDLMETEIEDLADL